MPTDKCRARLNRLFSATLNDVDVTQDRQIQVGFGPTGDVQRRFWDTAHAVDITQRVRRSNRPESIRIVHNGCEIVHRINEREFVGDAINPSIIGGFSTDKQVRIRGFRDFT